LQRFVLSIKVVVDSILNRTGRNISRLKHYQREVVHTSVSGSPGLKSQSVLLVVLSSADML